MLSAVPVVVVSPLPHTEIQSVSSAAQFVGSNDAGSAAADVPFVFGETSGAVEAKTVAAGILSRNWHEMNVPADVTLNAPDSEPVANL